MSEGGSARLFIALELPEDLCSLLRRLQSASRRPAAAPHLTLRFLGERPQTELESIRTVLRTVRVAPFALHLDGLGAFHRRGQSVLWAGIAPCPPLAALKARIDAALADLFPSEARPFHPHITLRRLRPPSKAEASAFIAAHSAAARGTFTVDSFALFRSVFSSAGAEHVAVERYAPGV